MTNNKPIKFALWEPDQKKYPEDAIILKFIETHNGIRCRAVNPSGTHIKNGALFFLHKNIRLYEHINPTLELPLVQHNRLLTTS